MPEEPTSFISKGKDAAGRYGNKAAHTVSAGLLIFLYTYFVPVAMFREYKEETRQHSAEQWRKLSDFDLKLDEIRMKIDRLERPHGFNGDSTNVLTVVAPIPTIWPTNTPLAVIR